MRKSCDIYIYVDLKRALQDGIKFYLSKNNVILTTGNSDGFLQPKYFAQVVKKTSKNTFENVSFEQ